MLVSKGLADRVDMVSLKAVYAILFGIAPQILRAALHIDSLRLNGRTLFPIGRLWKRSFDDMGEQRMSDDQESALTDQTR